MARFSRPTNASPPGCGKRSWRRSQSSEKSHRPHEHERGAELGLRQDEVAFYDAICQNDSAVLEMYDELLKRIARELVDSVPVTPGVAPAND